MAWTYRIFPSSSVLLLLLRLKAKFTNVIGNLCDSLFAAYQYTHACKDETEQEGESRVSSLRKVLVKYKKNCVNTKK